MFFSVLLISLTHFVLDFPIRIREQQIMSMSKSDEFDESILNTNDDELNVL